MIEKLRTYFTPLLLFFFVFTFLFRTDYSFDQDLGRHIKLGEIITQTHQIPKTNLFSYTNPDFPFINTHWLFEVVVFWFNASGILNWLLYLKVLVILAAVSLVLLMVSKQQYFLLLPIGFLFLHVLRERLELRPEIFSFLFTALTYWILQKFSLQLRESKRKDWQHWMIFTLPIIQLIWVNTHIYFFVGLILQGIFLLDIGLSTLRFHLSGGRLKIISFTLLLSVLASLVNPNGLTGFLYPINVSSNYGYTIVENQNMFLLESINFNDRNFLFAKMAGILIGLSIIYALSKKGWQVKNLLLATLGIVLALINVRSFPYLIFISMPAVIANFATLKINQLFRLIALLTGIMLTIESIFYLNGTYYRLTDNQYEPRLELRESVKGALDFVLANNLPGPIFNNFDIGSYIIYRAYPKFKVIVDGRPEAYPKDFFQAIYIPIESNYPKFTALSQKINFQTVIFSHTDQTPWGKAFLKSIDQDHQNWNLVYLDDFMVVYLKKEKAGQMGIKPIDLDALTAEDYHYSQSLSYLRLAFYLMATNKFKHLGSFIDKALILNPDSPTANSLKAQLLLSSGNPLNYGLAEDYYHRSKNLAFW